jgi:biotin carboxyl carrier protein
MRFSLRVNGTDHEVAIAREKDRLRVDVDGSSFETEVARGRDATTVTVGGQAFEIRMAEGQVFVDGKPHRVEIEGVELGGAAQTHAAGAQGRVRPPMPGKIIAVRAKVGDAVKPGDTLVVLEAMKMQNEITATVGGTVKEIRVQAGQTVEAKDVLLVIE